MFPVEHEIKDMIQSNTPTYYHDALLSIGRDRSTCRFLYHKHSVPELLFLIFARLWRFHLTAMRYAGIVPHMNVSFEGKATFQKKTKNFSNKDKLLPYITKHLKLSSCKFDVRYRDHETLRSIRLANGNGIMML